jgi:hypothetical protein
MGKLRFTSLHDVNPQQLPFASTPTRRNDREAIFQMGDTRHRPGVALGLLIAVFCMPVLLSASRY